MFKDERSNIENETYDSGPHILKEEDVRPEPIHKKDKICDNSQDQ